MVGNRRGEGRGSREGGRRERKKATNTLIGNVPCGYRLVGLGGRIQFVGARAGFIINWYDTMRNKKWSLCGFVYVCFRLSSG